MSQCHNNGYERSNYSEIHENLNFLRKMSKTAIKIVGIFLITLNIRMVKNLTFHSNGHSGTNKIRTKQNKIQVQTTVYTTISKCVKVTLPFSLKICK